MSELFRKTIETPVGRIVLIASERAIHELRLPPNPPAEDRSTPILETAAKQLEQYFAGERTQFDLPLEMEGTQFQRRVWDALMTIEYGETCSYADVARLVGIPKGSRAVGQANGRNPISIIVPCHRVIASDGTLGGYGGGLPLKEKLLGHESAIGA